MSLLALLSNFGGPDLIIILLIVLVLFGAKKLPELAKGMGQAVKEFQKAKDEFSDELHNAGNATPPKPDVRQAEATVARIDNAPTAREVPPQSGVGRPRFAASGSEELRENAASLFDVRPGAAGGAHGFRR
jgi:sec-independent protein translocase protein TatA